MTLDDLVKWVAARQKMLLPATAAEIRRDGNMTKTCCREYARKIAGMYDLTLKDLTDVLHKEVWRQETLSRKRRDARPGEILRSHGISLSDEEFMRELEALL